MIEKAKKIDKNKDEQKESFLNEIKSSRQHHLVSEDVNIEGGAHIIYRTEEESKRQYSVSYTSDQM